MPRGWSSWFNRISFIFARSDASREERQRGKTPKCSLFYLAFVCLCVWVLAHRPIFDYPLPPTSTLFFLPRCSLSLSLWIRCLFFFLYRGWLIPASLSLLRISLRECLPLRRKKGFSVRSAPLSFRLHRMMRSYISNHCLARQYPGHSLSPRRHSVLVTFVSFFYNYTCCTSMFHRVDSFEADVFPL